MRPGRAAYGPLATSFGDSLDADEPVVIFDQAGVAEALRDCMDRRFRGERFYVRALVQRDYALRIDAVAPSIMASFETLDERRAAFDQAFSGTLQVNGKALQSVAMFTHNQLRLMQAALRLADGLIVSSEAERRRVTELVQTEPPTTLRALDSQHVPVSDARGRERDAIVIWAPHLSGDAAYAFVAALGDLHPVLLLVSGTAPTGRSQATWVSFGDAAAALARAKLIVDTSAHGCDAARRLATWGAPIVADVESGAHEVLTDVRTYDRRRFSSVFESAISALGRCAPRDRAAFIAPVTDEPEVLEGPLVTIIIPTFDRPTLLRYALESIRRQTYRTIETIVVVDGGPRLDALAADFPEVHFMHMPENNAVISCNAAFARAAGEYVTFLNDDDLFFPDHVASLVGALERSGESVAHGEVLTAFLRGSDDEWLLYGLESNMSRAVDKSALLVSNQIGMTSCLFRKRCLHGGEPFDATVPLYRDYALWLRLASENDFVHVERITSCYTIRNQGQAQQSMMRLNEGLESYEVLYARYPAAGRPAIEQMRAQTLQGVAQGGTALAAAPAMEIEPAKWPLFGG